MEQMYLQVEMESHDQIWFTIRIRFTGQVLTRVEYWIQVPMRLVSYYNTEPYNTEPYSTALMSADAYS